MNNPTPVTTNDLKKGTRIKLANGWEAILEDNRKGNVRMARVFGLEEEIGSVYAHDIVGAALDQDGSGNWVKITHTNNQSKCKDLNESIFG